MSDDDRYRDHQTHRYPLSPAASRTRACRRNRRDRHRRADCSNDPVQPDDDAAHPGGHHRDTRHRRRISDPPERRRLVRPCRVLRHRLLRHRAGHEARRDAGGICHHAGAGTADRARLPARPRDRPDSRRRFLDADARRRPGVLRIRHEGPAGHRRRGRLFGQPAIDHLWHPDGNIPGARTACSW